MFHKQDVIKHDRTVDLVVFVMVDSDINSKNSGNNQQYCSDQTNNPGRRDDGVTLNAQQNGTLPHERSVCIDQAVQNRSFYAAFLLKC